MSNYNLTNQEISSSFQQVMQHDKPTGLIYDGTGSLIENLSVTSSEATHALTASYAENAQQIDTGSFATTGSNSFTAAQSIIGDISQFNGNFINYTGGNIQTFGGNISGTTMGSSDGASTMTGSFNGDGSGLTNVTASNGGVTSIIAGTNIIIDQSQGDVTIQATTTASADWGSITSKPSGLVSGSSQLTSSYDTRYQLSGSEAGLPSGVVSGSSQIILQSTTGDLSGSRIDGQVSSALSSSYALTASVLLGSIESASYADNALSASHALHSDTTQEVIINVKNTSGVTLVKGTPVYATGVTGDNINIASASNDSSNTMPAIAVLGEALTNNQSGVGVVSGKIVGVDTNGFTSGRNIYVNSNGDYTQTKPTGTKLIQNIGVVGKVNVTDGEIVIQGSGRSNDLPNIQNGYTWVGDGSGVPQAVATSSFAGGGGTIDTGSFATTGSNVFVGDQTISGSLIVQDSIEAGGNVVAPNGAVEAAEVAASNVFFDNIQSNGAAQVTIQKDTVISGSTTLKDVSPGPASVLSINDGSQIALSVNNSALAGIVGSSIQVQGNSIFSGNQLVTGNISVTGSVDALGGLVSKQNMEVVNPSGNPYIRIGNTTKQYQFAGMEVYTDRTINPGNNYAGFTVFDTGNSMNGGININTYTGIDGSTPVFQLFGGGGSGGNGQTILAAKDDSTVEFFKYNKFNNTTELNNNLLCNGPSDFKQAMQVTGSFKVKDAQAGPASTFIVNDGSSDILTVNNSALAGIVGTNVTVNGSIGIGGEIVMSSAGQVIDIPNGTVNSNELVANIAVIEEIESGTGTINLLSETHFKNGIRTDVGTLGISNSTASIDFNDTTMQTLTLPSSGDTRLEFSNASDGRVTNLLVKATGAGTVSFGSNILQPSGSSYQATPVNGGRDILTFTTFDNSTTSEVYLINVVNLV